MTHVVLVLVGLAVLAPLPGAALGPVVLLLAGAVIAAAVWSYRADPSPWTPPPGWTPELIR